MSRVVHVKGDHHVKHGLIPDIVYKGRVNSAGGDGCGPERVGLFYRPEDWAEYIADSLHRTEPWKRTAYGTRPQM